MLRLSKLTDYGIVLLAHLAREGTLARGGEAATHNARELAAEVELPLPAVSKILKTLTRSGVLDSQRGIKGGYALARRPEELTVAEMIEALDGPVAITQCSLGPQLCEHEVHCSVRGPWQVINEAVQSTLAQMTLADLIDPGFAAHAQALRLVSRPGAGDARE